MKINWGDGFNFIKGKSRCLVEVDEEDRIFEPSKRITRNFASLKLKRLIILLFGATNCSRFYIQLEFLALKRRP